MKFRLWQPPALEALREALHLPRPVILDYTFFGAYMGTFERRTDHRTEESAIVSMVHHLSGVYDELQEATTDVYVPEPVLAVFDGDTTLLKRKEKQTWHPLLRLGP